MDTLKLLIEKCAVTIEFAGDRWRLSGKGLIGVIAVIAIVALIINVAPQLLANLHIR